MLETPYTRWEGDRLHGRQPAVLAHVWVQLEAISGFQPGDPQKSVIDGLDLRGQVPGMITGYLRGSRGEWLAVVSYGIPFADGRDRNVRVTDQLVTHKALRKRELADGAR